MATRFVSKEEVANNGAGGADWRQSNVLVNFRIQQVERWHAMVLLKCQLQSDQKTGPNLDRKRQELWK